MIKKANLTIKTDLITIVAVLVATTIGVCVFGYTAVNAVRKNVVDVYVPAHEIRAVVYDYDLEFRDLSKAIREGADLKQIGSNLEAAHRAVDKHWKRFLGTEIEPRERKLIDETSPLMAKTDAALAKATEALDTGDIAKIKAARTAYDAAYDEMTPKFDDLLKLEDNISEEDYANAEETFSHTTYVYIGIAVFIAIVAALSTLIILGWIIRPLHSMAAAMKLVAERNYDAVIPNLGERNELGSLASALNVFKTNGLDMQRMDAEQQAESRVKQERTTRVNALTADFEVSVGEVIHSVSSRAETMESSARSLSLSAEQSTQQTAAVAAASEEASSNVQTVASATEELSASIAEISRQVAQSTRIAANAVGEADRANAMVQGLAEASQKIGAVVALITDIANQTNLLALNATIEAARAGEAGKGFAVVAAEVKNLANQTAKATEEIGGQISGIQAATKDAVDAIASIGKTIGDINGIASTIAAAVEEQSAATKEIARNVEQAATGTEQVTSNITGVSQAANDTGSAASEVLASARDLAQQSESLKAVVTKFLANVKAA